MVGMLAATATLVNRNWRRDKANRSLSRPAAWRMVRASDDPDRSATSTV